MTFLNDLRECIANVGYNPSNDDIKNDVVRTVDNEGIVIVRPKIWQYVAIPLMNGKSKPYLQSENNTRLDLNLPLNSHVKKGYKVFALSPDNDNVLKFLREKHALIFISSCKVGNCTYASIYRLSTRSKTPYLLNTIRASIETGYTVLTRILVHITLGSALPENYKNTPFQVVPVLQKYHLESY